MKTRLIPLLLFYLLFFTDKGMTQAPDTLLASQYYQKASTLSDSARYDSSITYFKKASILYKKAALWDRHVQAYNEIGESYLYLAKYDSALIYLEEALKTGMFHFGKDHPDVAKTYCNIATYHLYKGEYDQGLKYSEKALTILKIFGEYNLDIADSYSNIGFVYAVRGDYDQGLDYFQKALTIQVKILGEYHSTLGSNYNQIGAIYSRKDEYERSLIYHQKALDVMLQTVGKLHPEVAQIYNDIGSIYSKKGDHDQALTYFHKALDIQLRVLDKSHPDLGSSYISIGFIYKHKEDYDQALTYFHKALDIQEESLGKSHPYVAVTYHIIGNVYISINDYDQASSYYQKALKSDQLPNYLATSYSMLGICYFKAKNWDQALTHYQLALQALTNDFDNSDIYVNPRLKNIKSKSKILQALILKATALATRYIEGSQNLKDLLFSFKTYQLAVGLVDTLRYEYTTKDARQTLNTSSLQFIYKGGIWTAHQLHQVTKEDGYLHQAFALAEKSKAFLLQQTLKESNALQFADIPDSLVQQENVLKIDLAFYKKKIVEAQNKKDTAKTVMYQNYLFDRRQTFDSLVQALEQNYPQYHALKYEVNTPTVQQVQALLPDSLTTLVEYFVGEKNTYAFVINKSRFQVVKFKQDTALAVSITALRESIEKEANTTNASTQFTQTAHQLWQQLLQPLDTLIQSATSGGQVPQLIIVPDGPLHFLPFDALLTQPVSNPQTSYAQLPYLINNYRISHAPSASLWMKSHRENKSENQVNCLAFAPSYPGETSSLQSRGTLDLLRNTSLNDLPGALEEVKALARHTEGTFFTGEAATEAHFKQYAPQASVIHLAMHGIVDTEYPENSRLVFTHSGDSIQDDSLFVYELYNMHLPSDLVVLSACNTGYGKLAKGEGMMSLARGFMYANSPNLVVSLWDANDKSTALIMDTFYAGLANGLSKDAALREAKLNYIRESDKNNPNPFYWAGMVPIGNMAPVALKKDSSSLWLYALIVALVLALGSIVVWRFMRAQKDKIPDLK